MTHRLFVLLFMGLLESNAVASTVQDNSDKSEWHICRATSGSTQEIKSAVSESFHSFEWFEKESSRRCQVILISGNFIVNGLRFSEWMIVKDDLF